MKSTSSVGVSPFFRDKDALKSLHRWALACMRTKGDGASLRVWMPCASSADVYSAVIILIEAFGKFWREIPLRVFSTGPDLDALSHARSGRYPPESGGISRARLERFFSRESHRIRVRPFVRDACRFVGHELEKQPPFSSVDLIICPQTLEDLAQPARRGVLRSFHSTLAPGGVLHDWASIAGEAPELFVAGRASGSYLARMAAAGAGGRGESAGLRESEERFRVLFSKVDDALLLLDAETDLIVDSNAAARRLFGWSQSELLLMRGKDLFAVPKAVRRLRGERRSEERLGQPHGRRKDGTFFPMDDSVSFIMLPGRPCRLWSVRDASERMRTNSGRRRDEDRNDSMGDIVHELRSPLSVIRGSAETLRKGIRGSRARTAYLRFIENHADRMGQLVDQLLHLGTTDSPKRGTVASPIYLSKAVRQIAAAFISVAKRRGITVKIGVPGGLAVLADSSDLPHVLGNLLDNAVKFTPRGGQVHVGARAEAGEVVLSVRDTGGGIPPQDLTRIFERFYRCGRTRSTKGSGLGLAIVQGIVKANGGRVFAENAPDGGAIFYVALPAAPAKRS